MKKRLLALLLIVCFVVAIPCQASAASNAMSSDNNEQKLVVQQKGKAELASIAAESNITIHYPGEEITAKCPSKSDDWTEDSLGYRAYMLVNGQIKYGFVTCGHSFNESTDGYVYAKDKKTKIGKIYENGYNKYDNKDYRYDFTFVELLPKHWVSDYTKYGGVKLTGVTSPKGGMKIYKEGMTTKRTSTVVYEYFNGYLSSLFDDNDFKCNGMFETDDCCDPNFANAHDSGGVVYNTDSKVLGIVIYEDSDKTVPYYSGITSADALQTDRKVYVDHGRNTIKLTLSNTQISWNKINGINDYYIYYRKGASGRYSKWKSVQGTTCDISSKGSGYEYIVYCSSGNVTSVSNSVKYGVKFSKPTGVTGTNDTKTNKPLITWNHVEGATNYEVMYSTDASTYKSAGTTGDNYFIHSKATDGVLYYYKVKVKNGLGSDLSSRAYTVCACNPPETTIKLDWATGKPKISWKPIAVASKYEIWMCKSPCNNNYTKLATVNKPSTSYIHTAAKRGDKYCYKVRAVVGSSVYGKYTEKKEFKCGWAQPTNVTVELDKDTGKPKVKWSAAAGAERYFIDYWDSSVDKNDLSDSISLGGVKVLERLHKNAVPGETYCYMVQSGWDNIEDFETIIRVDYKYEFPAPKITAALDASSKKPVISWAATPYANEYIIEVSTTGSNSGFTKLATQSGTTYTHSKAQEGQTYYYRVRGHYIGEKESYSDYSNVSSVSCLHGKPGFSVDNVASTGKPSLKWDAVPNAKSYDVYYSQTKDGSYTLLHNTTGTSFVHDAADANTKYFYYVVANNSAPSDKIENTCKYPQPSLSVVNDAETGKPILQWSPVAGATKYEVMYAESPDGEYNTLTSTDAVNLIHEKATLGTTYSYKVRVAVGAGSAYSAEKSIVCKLAQPVVTLSRNNTTGKPIVSWSSVSGADCYSVYYSTDKNGTYTAIPKQSDITYTHTDAEAGKTYYYKVEAHSNKYSSATSAHSVVMSISCSYAQPIVKVTTNALGKPFVKWESVPGATKYEVSCSENNGRWTVVKNDEGTSYVHSNATVGSKYRYKVRVSDDKISSYSAVCSTRCTLAKTTVTLSNDSATGKPIVSWRPVKGANCYFIYYSTSRNGTYTRIATQSNRTYIHMNAQAGKTYYYKVRAYTKLYPLAISEYSPVKSILCQRVRPKITAELSPSGKPYVKWASVPGTTRYQLWSRTSSTGWVLLSNTTSSTSYHHIDANAGTRYYYYLRVYSGDVAQYSGTVSVTSK